ncbi:hypothetical protein NDU88_005624 [Pleurodeles waltl]|uniref:Uncharacterized protein n=1 Tax=Pleurodeles waltl TaxID=8319 RepID=A0AAV7QJK8_PLEWA|nr:hypothetical protein NDU88_005624 [Pleurodeles waltl]
MEQLPSLHGGSILQEPNLAVSSEALTPKQAAKLGVGDGERLGMSAECMDHEEFGHEELDYEREGEKLEEGEILHWVASASSPKE